MSPSQPAPTVRLSNGVEMPRLGLGTWPMDDAQAEITVAEAIRAGYRLIDTAEAYGNETGVGRGLKASGIDRGEIFLTSKFNLKWHGYEEAQQAFAESAKKLGVDYIDLYLIHWPNPAQDRYVDAYRGMIKLLEDGKIRALGLSNFKPAHIDRLVEATGKMPQMNQIQVNPRIARPDEREYLDSHGIVTETWGPLGRGGDILQDPVIVQTAQAHGKTPGQAILRWHTQQGLVPIPKSSNPQRLAENLDVFSFELTPEEISAISALDLKGVGASDSDRFGH
jgi:2,5-diketo-D-gluconate reductase A